MLILEPSKLLQPAIVCVSEEDESRTVQLKHVTLLKVCRPSVSPNPQTPPSLLMSHLQYTLNRTRKKDIFLHFMIRWMFNPGRVCRCVSLSVTVCENIYGPPSSGTVYLLSLFLHVCAYMQNLLLSSFVLMSSFHFHRKAYTSGLSQRLQSAEWGKRSEASALSSGCVPAHSSVTRPKTQGLSGKPWLSVRFFVLSIWFSGCCCLRAAFCSFTLDFGLVCRFATRAVFQHYPQNNFIRLNHWRKRQTLLWSLSAFTEWINSFPPLVDLQLILIFKQ